LVLTLCALLASAYAQEGTVNPALLDTPQAGSAPVSISTEEVAVNRWDLFTGYSFLTSPTIGLNQNGFDTSFGMNLNRWLGLGVDFSYFGGSTNLPLSDTVLQGQIETILNTCTTPPCFPPQAVLPTISSLSAPISVKTFTFAAGPQINVRRVKESTLFVRPGLGLIHESADINVAAVNAQVQGFCGTPTGGIFCASNEGMAILGTLSGALKNPNMTDTEIFYGVGVGIDVNVNHRIGVRFTTDYVICHLFSNLLPQQQNFRFSIGPTWRFGDIAKPLKK
jgi:hypothetical protein